MKRVNNILKISFLIIAVGIFYYHINFPLYDKLMTICIIPFVLLPTILKKLHMDMKPGLEFAYLLFIFFAFIMGCLIDLYTKVPWYDTLIHFFSGIFSAFIGYIIFNYFKVESTNNKLLLIIIVICFTLAIAGLWEEWEYLCSVIFYTDPQFVKTTGVTDTMVDMFAAFIGSIVFCLNLLFKKK